MSESLGHLASTVGLNIDPFKSSATALKAQIKSTAAALKAQESAIKGAGNSVNGMKSAYGSMQQQMKNYNAQLERQKATYDKLKNTTAETEAEQQKLTARQANAANQYNRTSANIEALRARMATMKQQIVLQEDSWTRAGDKMVAFGSKTTQASQKLSAFGSGMTTKVTAPIVLGLAAAAKSAVDFNSQISAMGPLLTNGGKITATVRQELDQMGASSKQWSMQFGVSTGKINEGMTEMVKRGYSAKQTMGAMPAVLNAAKASGDDFNDVMHVSTSVLEQFGLKTNSTNGMLKNTSRVTDSLTYVANATAAGFQDMGEAMTYVGPSAHAAGISLEETAAAIGIMSNRGIEGSVAGTSLRGALTRLLKPSKQNVAGFKELGVNVADFKKGTLTLPQIIDKIKTNTKGWTDEQRASAVAMAFGTEAQAGMNALISAGGDELRKYTKGAKDSAGTTKEIADQLNDTQAAKVARFKESIHVLGIEVGEKLLPALTPLINKATDMVQSFSKMDSSTQQSIIKWAIFAAAIGPVAGTLGKVGSLIGGTSTVMGSLAKGIGRMSSAAKLGSTGLDVLKAGFSNSAYEATTFAGAASTVGVKAEGMAGGLAAAETGSTGLLAAIGPVGVAIGATALAAGVGVAAWELWGKKAYESSQRTERWGTDVGAAADKSLTKMQNFSTQTKVYMNAANSGTQENTEQIKKAFDSMASSIEQSSKRELAAVQQTERSLGDGYNTSALEKKATYYQQSIQLAQHAQSVVDNIEKGQSESKRKRTTADNQMILNAQNDLIEAQIKGLNLSSKKQKIVADQFAEDFKDKSVSQLNSMNQAYATAASKTKEYKGALDAVREANKGLSDSQKNSNWAKFVKDNVSTLGPVYDNYLAQVKKINSSSDDQATKQTKLQSAYGDLALAVQSLGIPFDTFLKVVKKSDSATKDTADGIVSTSTKMSSAVHDAANNWNDLVFDPKTGKMKTNTAEIIGQAKAGSDTWNDINLLVKEGKMDVKGMEEVSKATLATNSWNKLTPKNQLLVAKVTGNDKVIDALGKFKLWNELTPEQKTAVAQAKGQDEVFAAIGGIDRWNASTPEQQNAIIKTAGKENVEQAVLTLQNWNSMTPEQKQATVQTLGGEAVSKTILSMDSWNQMSVEQKNATVQSLGHPELLQMIGGIGAFNALNPKTQQAVAQAIGNGSVTDLTSKMNIWSGLTPSQKWAIANTQGSDKVWSAIQTFGGWEKLTPGQKTAVAKQIGRGDVQGAIDTVNKWRGTSPGGTKNASGADHASGQMNNAKRSVDSFRGTSPGGTKNANGSDHTSGQFGTATGAVNRFRGTSPGSTKNANAADHASGPANAASSAVGAFANKRDHTVTLTSIFKSIYKKITQSAKGTRDFAGGAIMVNDQAGPVFRELVRFPNGDSFVPVGRNVVFNAPKHTQVVPAAKTNHLLGGIPQFANGTAGHDQAVRTLLDAKPMIQAQQQSVTNNRIVQVSNFNGLEEKLQQLDKLTDIVGYLAKILAKNPNLYLDGKQVGESVEPTVSKNQMQNNILTERGIFSG